MAVTETARSLFDRLDLAIEAGLKDAVKAWHEQFLPRHFTVEGAAIYGYQKRSGEDEPAWVPSNRGIVVAGGKSKYGSTRVVRNRKYYWAKYRKMGTHDPLVYTGESKSRALSGVRVEASINSNGLGSASAIMDLPKYFYQRRLDLNAPDKVSELTRTIAAERVALLAVLDTSITRRIAAAPSNLQVVSS